MDEDIWMNASEGVCSSDISECSKLFKVAHSSTESASTSFMLKNAVEIPA